MSVSESVQRQTLPENPQSGQQLEPPRFSVSRQFPDWLAEHRLSIAFTTYQVGKLYLIGLQDSGRVSFFERTFSRCMGLCAHGGSLYMSSLYQVWRFENALQPGQTHEGYDRLYVPQIAWTTGDIDVHDMALDADGHLVFVNTLFSCLATVSERCSFQPLWKPPFISKLAAEDRCHLNGLAMDAGRPAYVTAVGRADVHEGWREHRRSGGILMHVDSGEVVTQGLSMPHSPRLHGGRVWLHDSGTGYFGSVDPQDGRFEPLTFCPGFLRGLAIIDGFAVVGLSRPRSDGNFTGLTLQDNLAAKGTEARCGVLVIDLASGDIVHSLRIEGLIGELYDVALLPGVRRPMAIGTKSDEIRRTLSIETDMVG